MDYDIDVALKEYLKIEQKLGINIGANSISVRESWTDSEFFWGTKHIAIAANLKTRKELKCHIGHEVFHCLEATMKLSQNLIRTFSSGRNISSRRRKVFREQDEDDYPPSGWISHYAIQNSEEDMAETFACFYLNDCKTSGWVEYEGDYFNLNTDKTLKKKFQAIKKIIQYIRDNQ